jgi:hypothetical protein
MNDRQLIPRKLNEQEQLKMALQMSQYNNLDKLILSQRHNQFRLHEATYNESKNDVADAEVMARILERAIKFSIH